MSSVSFGSLADSVFKHKYAHTKPDGTKESWEETADRVAYNVISGDTDLQDEISHLIKERKFLPGGRYLYASGRKYVQVNNCALLRAYDSRAGWADLTQRVTHCLMTGMGVGVDYSAVRERGASVAGLGGKATGPTSLMQIINETGRHIQQGGSRRSALWAGLRWDHPDILEFIHLKDWPEWMSDAKRTDFNAAATMDGTNISVQLNDAFFHAYLNPKHGKHSLARRVYREVVEQMLRTGEPGFSIDTGENAGQTLRNAPVVGTTYVLTDGGYRKVESILNQDVTLWTGQQWVRTKFTQTRSNDTVVTVRMTGRKEITCSWDHEFILEDGTRVPAAELKQGMTLKSSPVRAKLGRQEGAAYVLGLLYGDGSFHTKYPRAELPLCGKKESLLLHIREDMVNGPTPIPYTVGKDKRGITRVYFKNHELFAGRSKDVFPEDVYAFDSLSRMYFLAGLLDTDGCSHGGKCRLSSTHYEFLQGVGRVAESLGFSVLLNKGSDGSYKGTPCWTLIIKGAVSQIPCRLHAFKDCEHVRYKVIEVEDSGIADVYCCDVGVEEHSFCAEGVIISNCTEVVSADDNDICNLGSLNLARFDSLEDFRSAVYVATGFLLHGTVYSDLPTRALVKVKEKNRRLGLGLMGIHEWLLRRNKRYGPDADLAEWLAVYRDVSDQAAKDFADRLSVSKPVARRAIAPTGTISIIAETTSGIEPIFAVAFRRRYLKGNTWHAQYVVDSAAERLIADGIRPDDIEDAYSLAADPARRLDFQVFVQGYVDMAISSTLNLPAWGSSLNNPDRVESFGETLFHRLPMLRGVTAYPDGSRGGQPLEPVPYREAREKAGVEIIEYGNTEICPGGVCGA